MYLLKLPGLTFVLTLLLSACSSVAINEHKASATVAVQLLALNDFHGSLEAPVFELPLSADDQHPIASGGIARLATLVKQRAAGHRNSLIVGAGDLIGASPLLSSRFHDEPTIEALSRLGLSLSAVGNHELDKGLQELQRMQNGGCHPQTGCQGPAPFKGASFQYLAANIIDDSTGRPIFPAHAIREFDGIRIGFIGVVLHETPTMLTPFARSGLHFLDEATTINSEVAALRAEGIEALVVLLHQGGFTRNGPDDCTSLSGAITRILPKLDKAVDVVISGHTHRAYNCKVDGMLLTSANHYGTQLSDISLTLDRKSGDVVAASAETLVVATASVAEDPAMTRLIARYQVLLQPLLQRLVGVITAPLTTALTAAGENVMGNVIADAMRTAAARNSGQLVDAAFMIPGGVRSELTTAGPVRFADLFKVQPFGNELTVLTMTGADIEAVLRQQFAGGQRRILHVSEGFSFQWRLSGPNGAELVPGSVRINGEALQPERNYRVATNDFMVAGGDGFTVFAAARDVTKAGNDVDALEAHIGGHQPFIPPSTGRITLVTAP